MSPAGYCRRVKREPKSVESWAAKFVYVAVTGLLASLRAPPIFESISAMLYMSCAYGSAVVATLGREACGLFRGNISVYRLFDLSPSSCPLAPKDWNIKRGTIRYKVVESWRPPASSCHRVYCIFIPRRVFVYLVVPVLLRVSAGAFLYIVRCFHFFFLWICRARSHR